MIPSQETIHAFDADGNAVLIADSEDGLGDPYCMVFINCRSPCIPYIEPDGDIDGGGMADFATNFDSGAWPYWFALTAPNPDRNEFYGVRRRTGK